MCAQPDRRRSDLLDPGLLVGTTDAEILRGFVDLVRTWRGGSRRHALRLRGADVAVLVAILGTDRAEVERRLIAATACSPSLARYGRRLLLASVGMLVLGVLAVPVVGRASTATHQAVVETTPQAATTVPPSPAPSAAPDPNDATPFGQPDPNRVSVATSIPMPVPSARQPAAPTREGIPPGAEAILAIASVGIEAPVTLGGQSVIDQGLVAHYTAPGWEEPVPAGDPGTYWLAAHATTRGGPFRALPAVAVGAEIRMRTATQTFVYTVTSTHVTGLWPGDDLMYGTDPTASVILLQTCIDETRRLLVHGTLTATL